MRIALHSILKANAESGYDEAHRTIPADLADSFARLGIHNWSIWRSGRDLFHLVEVDDFAAAMDALATDPANERWQASIGTFVDHFVTTSPGPSGMVVDQVWDLREQRAETAD